MLAILQGWQTGLWTAMPGLVQSFDPEKRTCVVQPALKASVQKEDGSFEWIQLPLLVDCPVLFPSGGGVTLTFPIKEGDEALVVFGARCIDSWWQSGGIQVQAELRMHDLSDGFVFVGISSLPQIIPNIRTDRAELRNDEGDTRISIYPETKHIEVDTPSTVYVHAGEDLIARVGRNLDAEVLGDADVRVTGYASIRAQKDLVAQANGNVTVAAGKSAFVQAEDAVAIEGTSVIITGELIINGQPYLAHVHTGVQTGGGNTGGVL